MRSQRLPFLLLLLALLPCVVHAGPIFPSRGLILHPRWTGRTDTTSVLGHAGFWASVTRGMGSDSDRWGWSIITAGAVEFARWSGEKSLFAFSSMELTADTHNDISFNPHGAMWEEGLLYAVHENETVDWQLGAIYRCRHDIDNGDPDQYNGLGQGRTLIYCSLSGKLLYHLAEGTVLPGYLWTRLDGYLIREDYRLPPSTAHLGTDFNTLAWTIGLGAQLRIATWNASSLYVLGSANLSAFGDKAGFLNRFQTIHATTLDTHAELGYEFHGAAARLQIFGGVESWQDDGQTPIPRNTSYAIAGFRLSGVDLGVF